MLQSYVPFTVSQGTFTDLARGLYTGCVKLDTIKLQYSPLVSRLEDEYHRFRINNAKSVADIENELRSRVVVAWVDGVIEWTP